MCEGFVVPQCSWFESRGRYPTEDQIRSGLGRPEVAPVQFVAVGNRVSKNSPGDQRVNIRAGITHYGTTTAIWKEKPQYLSRWYFGDAAVSRGLAFTSASRKFTLQASRDNMDTIRKVRWWERCGWEYAAMLADVEPGKFVILGAGCIGLMTCKRVSSNAGATNIAVVDVLENGWQWLNDWARQPLSMGREDTVARCQQFTTTADIRRRYCV